MLNELRAVDTGGVSPPPTHPPPTSPGLKQEADLNVGDTRSTETTLDGVPTANRSGEALKRQETSGFAAANSSWTCLLEVHRFDEKTRSTVQVGPTEIVIFNSSGSVGHGV